MTSDRAFDAGVERARLAQMRDACAERYENYRLKEGDLLFSPAGAYNRLIRVSSRSNRCSFEAVFESKSLFGFFQMTHIDAGWLFAALRAFISVRLSVCPRRAELEQVTSMENCLGELREILAVYQFSAKRRCAAVDAQSKLCRSGGCKSEACKREA